MSRKTHSFVIVFWLDHCSPTEPWTDIRLAGEITPVMFCTSGWLISENKKNLVVASTLGVGEKGEPGNDAGGITCIVKSTIVKRIHNAKLDR